MSRINITDNSTVRLQNIGAVREAYGGDFSAPAKALGDLGRGIASIGKAAGEIATDLKEREDNAKVNDAMSQLTIASGKISDSILSDSDISPSEYQNRFQEEYERLYGEISKNLNAAQSEKLHGASTRLFTSSMLSMGHTAMRKTMQNEKESALRLCAATKERAIFDPTPDNINTYLGAFTDAQKDTVREIHTLEEAGNTKEAAALREALRIRQVQGVDEIQGESAMNEIRAAEDAGDEAALEALAKKDWRKSAYGIDPTDGKEKILNAYDQMLRREGFGDKAAHALKSQAETALRRVRSAKFEKAHNDAMETERQMFLKALPEDTDGIIARYGEEADTYAKLAENKNLTAAQRRSYANAAQSLRQAAAKVKHEVATQAQLNFFNGELTNFEGGKDLKTGKDLSYDEMHTRARELLSTGQITSKQFHRLMAVQKKELNEEQKRFRDLVYADFPKLMPNITQRDGRFVFTPSKKVPSADKSTDYEVDVERGFWNDTEETYTYGQFIRAMNAIFNLSTAQGLSAEEMKAMFDERTLPVRDGCNTKSVNQNLAEIEENASSAARARANPGSVPPFVQKGKRKAESGTKPWDSPLSIGSQYLRDIFNK
jgi:hypothetical protein